MSLTIKKRVNLDFLGEEFKDSYLTFRSIPAKDLPGIVEQTEKVSEGVKAIPIILEILKKYFLDGMHDEVIKKEDLDELDSNSIIECFQTLTGQTIDPKDEGLSTNTSTTEAPSPQK